MFWALLVVLMLTIAVTAMTGCVATSAPSQSDANNAGAAISDSDAFEDTVSSFEARIVESNDAAYLTEVTDGLDSSLQPGDLVYVPTAIDSSDSSEGNPLPKLAAGSQIRVTFAGGVMESYPLQIAHIQSIDVLRGAAE